MRQLTLLTILIGLTTTAAFCQKVTLDGYVFEELNRGYLNEVKVTVLEKSGVYIGETLSDLNGHFAIDVEANKEYNVQYEKKIFQTLTDPVSTMGKKAGDKLFLKRQLERQPGYLLEVTLADKRIMESVNVDAINGARIEIFNLTANREELVIDSAKSPVFSHTLLQGYHYVIMIRKKGYFTRRMDAHVNIDGCYLCMEGFGTVTPGMVSNLTSARDNKIGTLLANVDLSRIDTTQNIVFQNIYYAYNSAELTAEATKELDKVTALLQNNGALIVELGSHTDARGSDGANKQLSQARAESAVNHILNSGMIDRNRLEARGYGESKLVNRCEDGTPCSEAEHLRNRRTELKIIGFTIDLNEGKSLSEIVHAEEMIKFIKASESQKEYRVSETTPSVPARSMQQLESGNVPTPTAIASSPIVTTQLKPTPVASPKLGTANAKVNISPVEATFSGYKVEVFATPTPLPETSEELQNVGNTLLSEIAIDKLKNGQNAYLVGTFLNWSETERFLEKVQTQYPKARIVEFFNGKRIGL